MKKVLMVGAALVVAAGTAFAGAHGSMSDKRVDAMKGVGGAMKAIGEGTGDPVENAMKAKMLLDGMLELFPEGSAEYRAKANIWTDWAGFEKSMMETQARADDLVAAAKSGGLDAARAALGPMGKTCKACHDEYRGPKPN